MTPNAAPAEAPTASRALASPLPAAPTRRPNRTFRALRHRNYRLYFIGQLISLTGSWVQTTALTWLAWDRTDKALWAGLVVAAQVLPALLLGPWGGALADRLPKRPLIMATQAGFLFQALALAAVVACGWLTPWAMLGFAAAAGVVNACWTSPPASPSLLSWTWSAATTCTTPSPSTRSCSTPPASSAPPSAPSCSGSPAPPSASSSTPSASSPSWPAWP